MEQLLNYFQLIKKNKVQKAYSIPIDQKKIFSSIAIIKVDNNIIGEQKILQQVFVYRLGESVQ